jgi:hypothetical protein
MYVMDPQAQTRSTQHVAPTQIQIQIQSPKHSILQKRPFANGNNVTVVWDAARVRVCPTATNDVSGSEQSGCGRGGGRSQSFA